MEPSVSLHHFVHPAWFDDLGGWGKEENVQLFAKFAEWSFQQFGMRAKLWATFNEPSVRRLIPTWQCHRPQHLPHPGCTALLDTCLAACCCRGQSLCCRKPFNPWQWHLSCITDSKPDRHLLGDLALLQTSMQLKTSWWPLCRVSLMVAL